MQPIRLYLKNFCTHAETEFSFNDFSSALIIGKVKNNDRFSNGSGKSTIFNAIEYVFFNEIHFSSLSKVIRDGCDVCRVEIDFISSLDKSIYRIARSNSKKTGTDVRLFKQHSNLEWEDLTQRRVSDTEKEIVKVVGFNYKAFCASVLFNQPGSENNIQKDFGNLPALTPEKRKSVLREVLQLHMYLGYEKLAKAKQVKTQSDLEKQKVILGTIGNPEELLPSLEQSVNKVGEQLFSLKKDVVKIKDEIFSKKTIFTILSEKLASYNNDLSSNKIKLNDCLKQIGKYENLIVDLNAKIAKLPDDAKKVQDEINVCQHKLKLHLDYKSNKDNLILLIKEKNHLYYSNKSNLELINKNILLLNKPITDEDVCGHCHQTVSQEHKNNWFLKINEQKTKLDDEKKHIINSINILSKEIENFQNQLNDALKIEQEINILTEKVKYLSNDLNNKRLLYENYGSLIEEHQRLLKDQRNNSDTLRTEQLKLENTSNKDILKQSNDINLEILSLENILKRKELEINALTKEQAVFNHKISECKNNIIKIAEIKKEIQEFEKTLILYSKVVQAFGSGGIPALITNSVLDELQNEANKWLFKLRPGLQLQFVIANEKGKKEREDTLDIEYFIDGCEREYKQLSGAQKIVVSLSIKMALLFIMNKIIGIDIKLMLLDEVDQALDPGSTEIFADIIKVIQDEIKVIVITHDDDLKYKFSHAILVEQDENNASRGKLINW